MNRLSSDTLYGFFKNTAEKYREKTALIYLGTKFTYKDLLDLVEKFAESLASLGITKEDKAILYLSNTPQWMICWLGFIRIGAIPVPISPIYTPVDLKYMANDCEAETIVCMDTNFGYVKEVVSETRIKNIIVTSMVDLLPLWKRLLGRAFNRIPKGKFFLGNDTYSFKRLLSNNSPPLEPYEHLRISGDDYLEMLYTGGTTGFPKGVPFSNLGLVNAFVTMRSMSEPVIPLGEDILVQGAPLFHALGQSMLFGGLLSGDTCVILPRVHLDGLFESIQRHQAKSFFGVPMMYRLILEHKRVDDYDLGSLEYCFCAGDVLPQAIPNRWTEKYGIPICQGYGATETCAGVSLTPANVQNPPAGSSGKLLPGKKVKIVEPYTTEPVKDGEPGELLVSFDHMVKSYWKKPEETDKCFVQLDGSIYYRTNDIVEIDKDGWLFFKDRFVDTIKHKGYRIAASEIEARLQEHSAVVAACVVGIPDSKVGERIKAFVVLKEDIRGVTGYDLLKWCRKRLAPYKVPHYIEFRDMLPKSKVGKVLRREIRSTEQRKLEETTL